jgi:UDP-glucuronate 4-epimerase
LKVLVTGSAGFIGSALALRLLERGDVVIGIDNHNDYYDPAIKEARLARFVNHPNYTHLRIDLADRQAIEDCFATHKPERVVNLAAQAGVRYSLENPRAYLDANVIGSFNVLEVARRLKVQHLLMASTSSVYGANEEMPFAETQKADTQLTIYAATKKASESMGHAYAHLWSIPTTMFRFFTVYGPWGRPDMALFKFVEAILQDRPIEVYNHGEMFRDFTYVADLVQAIRLLIDTPPPLPHTAEPIAGDTLSPVAPWRVVNIGNSDKVKLLDFVDAIEQALGRKAQRTYLPMQAGDVPATGADASLLRALTGYAPKTDVKDGIAAFVAWYREYYNV